MLRLVAQVGRLRNAPGRVRRKFYMDHTLPRLVKRHQQIWRGPSADFFWDLRRLTLSYVARNRVPEQAIGTYTYKTGGTPLLYASCYAALTRHLLGDLEQLSIADRSAWSHYIEGFQTDDGLFRDPAIHCPEAETGDWWGWRHLTVHALMAISALGGLAQKPFRAIDAFRTHGGMLDWLGRRNWGEDAANASNEIQNIATMLQYARDFQDQEWCQGVLEEMYGWLDARQDAESGYWGYDRSTPWGRSLGVQTGYHLWLLYFYDGRLIQHTERIVDSCLVTQNRLGGFGVPANSSACEDIDSIDPLVRLGLITDYRREDIRSALRAALPWVLTNRNADGGWVFRRGEGFRYGHELMCAGVDKSSMFPTWFRVLSLAYLSRILPESGLGELPWRFFRCPGHQFFR